MTIAGLAIPSVVFAIIALREIANGQAFMPPGKDPADGLLLEGTCAGPEFLALTWLRSTTRGRGASTTFFLQQLWLSLEAHASPSTMIGDAEACETPASVGAAIMLSQPNKQPAPAIQKLSATTLNF